MQLLRSHFRPEFLNRIDEIIVFRALTKEQVIRDAELLPDRVRRRLRSQHRPDIHAGLGAFLADRGYDPEFGARLLPADDPAARGEPVVTDAARRGSRRVTPSRSAWSRSRAGLRRGTPRGRRRRTRSPKDGESVQNRPGGYSRYPRPRRCSSISSASVSLTFELLVAGRHAGLTAASPRLVRRHASHLSVRRPRAARGPCARSRPARRAPPGSSAPCRSAAAAARTPSRGARPPRSRPRTPVVARDPVGVLERGLRVRQRVADLRAPSDVGRRVGGLPLKISSRRGSPSPALRRSSGRRTRTAGPSPRRAPSKSAGSTMPSGSRPARSIETPSPVERIA